MNSQAGFTLTELLIVIALITTSAALAAPAIGAAMSERRVTQAQLDVLRVARRARSEALAVGRAHLIRFTTASSPGDHGRMRLYRGTTSSCGGTDWATVTGAAECIAPECIDDVNLGDSDYRASATHFVHMRGSPDNALIDLCYTSSGMMWHRVSAAAPFSDQNNTNGVAGGYTFSLQSKRGGSAQGVQRWVVFPLGGTPRTRI
ncbi:MAG: type II secretion system protein [Myxococcales bacterium]|nr:type II secretion system protein [Myxococcales bacterium]MCB9707364.1 type II secretion system protein [Myxococcales bacterium]